jgi:hypothetical protein
MHSKERKKIAQKIVGRPKKDDSLKRNSTGRATEAMTAQRTNYIVTLLVAGENRRDIIKYTADWGLSESMIDQYIGKARELMVEEFKSGRASRKALYNTRLEEQYKKANMGTAPQDARAAAQILEIAARINGDTAPLEIELTEKKQHDLSKLNDDELRTYHQILKKLEQ